MKPTSIAASAGMIPRGAFSYGRQVRIHLSASAPITLKRLRTPCGSISPRSALESAASAGIPGAAKSQPAFSLVNSMVTGVSGCANKAY